MRVVELCSYQHLQSGTGWCDGNEQEKERGLGYMYDYGRRGFLGSGAGFWGRDGRCRIGRVG